MILLAFIDLKFDQLNCL
ncbi:unnamed protein product [Spirodela intermedia]|uniref:Uncharacterized protein n=1 Tax=Spirodela intermedia TaxID=51605 RepID=A0ABN7EAI2_SPIIN|nr:unnamed protein product [Spirodela intermedia]